LAKDTACFDAFHIAHNNEENGYSDTWYDAIDIDEEAHNYYFTPATADGNLYVTAETYSQDIIPSECTSGVYEPTG